MSYPPALLPTASESIALPGGGAVLVPKVEARFAPWRGSSSADTYGRKTLLAWDERPAFAELVVLWTLQREGWEGVWVDSYRSKYRVGLLEEKAVELPSSRRALLESVRQVTGQRGGVWDVYGWRDERVLFVELKRRRRDRIRLGQRRFLEAALKQQLSLEAFLIVEWDLGDIGP
jgi:hypothetical protein